MFYLALVAWFEREDIEVPHAIWPCMDCVCYVQPRHSIDENFLNNRQLQRLACFALLPYVASVN